MKNKLYIVNQVDDYDSWPCSYHLSRKGALREIMRRNYLNWQQCRYVIPGSYDDLHLYISESELYD